MPKSHGRRKKTRTHVPEASLAGQADGTQGGLGSALDNGSVVPRSLVIKKSKLSPSALDLLQELRKLMSPNTSMKLKERKYNKLKDFASVCAPLHISHLLILNQSFNAQKAAGALTIRIARYPAGPTLTFKVIEATMSRDVKRQQKRIYDSPSLYLTAPMVVLNNFNHSADGLGNVSHHIRLMKATFQNMFPALNVHALKLTDCRRVVLFNYDPRTDTVSLRHFAIKAIPISLTRNVRKLVSLKRSKKIPNLGKLTDISQYLSRSLYQKYEIGEQARREGNDMMLMDQDQDQDQEEDGNSIGTNNTSYGSDSEIEDETCHVTLPEKYKGMGNSKSAKSSIKLIELGPRLTLKLIRVQKEFLEGSVLYEAKYDNRNYNDNNNNSREDIEEDMGGDFDESDDEQIQDDRDFTFSDMKKEGEEEQDDDDDDDDNDDDNSADEDEEETDMEEEEEVEEENEEEEEGEI